MVGVKVLILLNYFLWHLSSLTIRQPLQMNKYRRFWPKFNLIQCSNMGCFVMLCQILFFSFSAFIQGKSY